MNFTTRQMRFLILHMVLPLFFGAAFYYLVAPDVFFVQKIDALLGWGLHFPVTGNRPFLLRLARNYLPDMLWGYALMFALYGILKDNNVAKTGKILGLSVFFSLVLELLQLTPFIAGTFDIFDLLAEAGAQSLAAIIINHEIA
jgi:uncharacterized MnhB-related membrane protein